MPQTIKFSKNLFVLQKHRFLISAISVVILSISGLIAFANTGTSRSTSFFRGNDATIVKGATKSNGVISFNDKVTTPPTTSTTSPNTGFEAFDRSVYWVSDSWTGGQPLTPQASGAEGAFRTNCHPSHLAYVDPIVKFNQPGASHLHMFFGNRKTTFNSTVETLKNTGMGSCDGGPLNRTAYWIPAMMQNATQVAIPFHSVFYYKVDDIAKANVNPMPEGLRMIAGDGMAHQIQNNDGLLRYKFKCTDLSQQNTIYDESKLIGNCPANSILNLNFFFPQCWDGRNLDSADHKSHLTYLGWGQSACPISHPVLLPQVSLNMQWKTGSNSTANWYLSSDDMSSMGMGKMPGGTTIHADWFMAWDREVSNTFVNNCLKKRLSCNGGQTGDGRNLKRVSLDYTGSLVVSAPSSKTDTVVLANSGL